MTRKRIGVVGLGFGEYHVRTIAGLDGAVLAAVADRDRARSDRVASECGVRGFTDGIEMMRAGRLDGVSLCVPPRRREPLLTEAIRLNLPVFVEKPWAADSAQSDRLSEIVRGHERRIVVGFSFRYHPAMRRLLALLDGELGRPLQINAEYVFEYLPPAESWLWDPKNGNGIVNENSCHIFDAVCAVMGAPKSLFAYGGRFKGLPGEDGVCVALRFEDGGCGTVTVGGLGASGFRNYPFMTIAAENGRAELIGRHHVWERIDWGLRGEPLIRSHVEPPEELERTRYTDAFAHFLKVIDGVEKPKSTVDDGATMVRVAEAVYESLKTARPVSLSGDGGETL